MIKLNVVRVSNNEVSECLVIANTQFHSFFSHSWLYMLLVRVHISDMMVHSNLLAILKQLQVLI